MLNLKLSPWWGLMLLVLCNSVAVAEEERLWWSDDVALTHNVAYVPLMRHLWKDVRDNVVQEDVRFFRPVAYVPRLNSSCLTADLFAPGTFVARIYYGYKLPDLKKTFLKDRTEQISGVMPAWEEPLNALDVVGYCGLGRHVQLPRNLFNQRKTWSFGASPENPQKVQGFGVIYSEDMGPDLMQKIHVVEYNNPDDFIIRFSFKSPGDECFIAKIPPLETFSATLNYIQDRISKDQNSAYFLPGDSLFIPELHWYWHENRKEMENNGVENATRKGWFVSQLMEEYAVALDAEGADWEVQDLPFMTTNIHMGSLKISSQREYLLDKPFLLMLRRFGAQEPYLALWIYDAEFLKK